MKREDRLEGDYLQSSLTAQYRDCSLNVTCSQAPSQNFTALSYQRLCASSAFVGDIDDKLMREFDANLNPYGVESRDGLNRPYRLNSKELDRFLASY